MNRDYRRFAAYFVLSVVLAAVMGVVFFLTAWTLSYWQAWVLMAAMIGSIGMVLLVSLARGEPVPVPRRSPSRSQVETESGPQGLPRSLRIAGPLVALAFVAALVVPGFDRRFGWSSVPPWISLVAVLFFAAGWVISLRVRQEMVRWSSGPEEVQDWQIMSTGSFGVVRYPFATGSLLYQAAMPVALGSWWGLVPFAVTLMLNVVVLLYAERIMREKVPGYAERLDKVDYRLVPYVW
ncbi:isoprenylcysteine carboxylmethyltransferase family protein [Nocardia altamirensis]|uniref:isoprenylcysteine carboxylmethyltransferase family protein n=1 Tax=Nocardia altamirensis TaxID=472158 RepID=UPI00083FF0F5|nr:isoprenylcysteine carboxylmethyltransferase family protein [Nocardia altamirensis]